MLYEQVRRAKRHPQLKKNQNCTGLGYVEASKATKLLPQPSK